MLTLRGGQGRTMGGRGVERAGGGCLINQRGRGWCLPLFGEGPMTPHARAQKKMEISGENMAALPSRALMRHVPFGRSGWRLARRPESG